MACPQVFVSIKYKFIYIRQPKASSTSLMAVMNTLYCGGRKCKTHEFTQVSEAETLSSAMWRSYFVFTVVRNPIARMISAYLMFTRYFLFTRDPHYPTEKGAKCSLAFPEYAKDAFALRRICNTRACCAYIAGQPGSFVDNFPNGHVTQQAHTVFTTAGRLIVDYIGRTENISEDWQEIATAIEQRSGIQVGFVPINNVNGVNIAVDLPPERQHACLTDDVVSLGIVNETTVRDITLQFAMDMQWFQFRART